MKLSTLVIAVPALVLALVVAIANRTPVTLSIDPFSAASPVIAFEVPLYLLIFAALLIGVLIGGSSAWIGQMGWRKKARKTARDVKHLTKDLERREAVPAQTSGAKEPGAESGKDQKRLSQSS